MATSTNTLNDINFDSFFQEKIIDNNGISVTDINAGLRNLFTTFNEKADKFYTSQHYLVTENEEGYPDLIAKNSITSNQKYWWWITLLNRLEDPITDFKSNWVYSINTPYQINDFIDKSNQNGNKFSNDHIGKLVELN